MIAKDQQTAPYRIAWVYAWCGDKDRAFDWIDRAYAQGNGFAGFKNEPLLAKLRDDPRYAAMLKKLNLPP